jgi:hypothetical protein
MSTLDDAAMRVPAVSPEPPAGAGAGSNPLPQLQASTTSPGSLKTSGTNISARDAPLYDSTEVPEREVSPTAGVCRVEWHLTAIPPLCLLPRCHFTGQTGLWTLSQNHHVPLIIAMLPLCGPRFLFRTRRSRKRPTTSGRPSTRSSLSFP